MQILQKSITINSRKFDNSIHKCWNADLIFASNSLLKFNGIFENEIKHEHLGIIRPGTISVEYFWLDKYFSIFQFFEPDGSYRNFYCNINLPPTFHNAVLDFTDLDIDVVVWQNFNYKILDMEEFKINSIKFNYPEYIVQKAKNALSELEEIIKAKKFPFNYLPTLFNG